MTVIQILSVNENDWKYLGAYSDSVCLAWQGIIKDSSMQQITGLRVVQETSLDSTIIQYQETSSLCSQTIQLSIRSRNFVQKLSMNKVKAEKVNMGFTIYPRDGELFI